MLRNDELHPLQAKQHLTRPGMSEDALRRKVVQGYVMDMYTKAVLVISADPDSLAEALGPFRDAGFTVRTASALDAALALLDPSAPPALVLLDARDDADGATLRADAMRVLSRCALTWLTAVSPISAGAFHDVMEGLGMLPPLPLTPARRDGEALLTALRRFLPED